MKILLGIVLGVVALSLARPYLRNMLNLEHIRVPGGSGLEASGGNAGDEHFAPTENLEDLDLKYLSEARDSVDVAMYAFTDRRIAEKLKELAVGRVNIRIYRDPGQFRGEEERAGQFAISPNRLLRGSVNIQIRVKEAKDDMHLKAYCVDHRVLRDGSANWSPSGEQAQDNQIRFTTDPGQVGAFERTFEGMWSRTTNRVVQ